MVSDLPLLLTVRSPCVPRCPPRLTAGLPGTGQSSQICVMEAVRVKFLIVDLWSEPVGPTALRPIDVPPNIPDVLNVVVVYGCGKGDSLFDLQIRQITSISTSYQVSVWFTSTTPTHL